MPPGKRRRNNNSLADTVNIWTFDDDDKLVEFEDAGEGRDYWTFAKAQVCNMWELLSYQRQGLFNSSSHGVAFSDVPIYNPDDPDDDDWNDVHFEIPVGDEGTMNSNAGGEYGFHTFLNSLLEDAPRHIDLRERHYQTQDQNDSWERQLPLLVDAYLRFQAWGPLEAEDDEFCEGEEWEIMSIDFFDHKTRKIRHVQGALTANETLTNYGLLGGSPDDPTVSFPFRFLESFRQINHVCPRYSIAGLSRTLTNTHGRFPNPHLEQQLRIAYDAYLSIQREVQKRVGEALGCDSHNHFIHNVCPPCTYQLENELPLNPSILMAMDGNNSLKLVDTSKRVGRERLDTRRIDHPRWLTADFVDEYQDGVVNARRKTTTEPQPIACDGPQVDDDENLTWLNDEELDDLAGTINPCVERWKAAGPDASKKMFSFFSISGIFLSVCRHGHVLVICDMRRSGELMKYPLAVVKALLDRYGKDLGLGYDIMCAFYRTLLRSTKLRDQVVALRLKGVVPAFHGHAHNRKCQVHWHPLYTKGVGLEDFEECERTFLQSNHLASTTRLTTTFHRHQALMEYFDLHDRDKHTASDNFIYQNYRQALAKIGAEEALFRELCTKCGVIEDDCKHFLQDEIEHFSKEHKDSPELTVKLDYVEMLQRLTRTKTASDEAHAKYQSAQCNPKVPAKQLQSLHTRSRTALERYKLVLEEVLVFEDEHNHYRRWSPTDQEYQETVLAMRGRNYRRALERLERLVVQRLLELTKLNMSGVGYKQREKITQALRARAKAIQKALDEYNEAAVTMEPSRPRLEWKDILDMVSLADFDLLKDTHLDLTHVPWAQPHHRECVRMYFGLTRAREEITRLNIEICRLITFMLDEHADHYHAVRQLEQAGNYRLAEEVLERMRVMVEIDGHVAIRLVQTSELAGFSGTSAMFLLPVPSKRLKGSLLLGCRHNRDPRITDTAKLPAWATVVLGLTRTDDAGTYTTSTTSSKSFSDILPAFEGEGLDPEGLLDYFEGLGLQGSRHSIDSLVV
ncbi:hypothetical protein PQX77_019103 [Marasmius sp. AFHP31]|nr:hypothetical protein PQX77_019103 [Marasmius sp. AFHP31]